MARVGLGWSTTELARVSGVSLASIERFEAGGSVKAETVLQLANALVAGGAMFVVIDGKLGVLLNP